MAEKYYAMCSENSEPLSPFIDVITGINSPKIEAVSPCSQHPVHQEEVDNSQQVPQTPQPESFCQSFEVSQSSTPAPAQYSPSSQSSFEVSQSCSPAPVYSSPMSQSSTEYVSKPRRGRPRKAKPRIQIEGVYPNHIGRIPNYETWDISNSQGSHKKMHKHFGPDPTESH